MIPIKIMTVIGTRPEIIRLSSIIKFFDKLDTVNHVLIHTGQNYDYELNDIFFDDLELRKPDYFLDAAKETAVQTIASAMISIDSIIKNEKPDAFLVLGDTNSALTAIVAKKHKVPIFHMEAGNRSFDNKVPEEVNRKILDHISEINLPYSSIAREYLIREGIRPETIIKTGSPMFEVIHDNMEKIKKSKILDFLNLKKNEYFLVSTHRAENVDSEMRLREFYSSITAVSDIFSMPIIFSTHPRTLNRLEKFGLINNPNIKILKPFNFSDYCNLQTNAKIVLSDSGTISEETAILNLKSLNIRYSQERPEAFEVGAVPLVGYDKNNILQAIDFIEKRDYVKPVYDYQFDKVSQTVLNAIISFYNKVF